MEIITDVYELKKPNFDIDLYESKSIIEKLEISLTHSKTKGLGLAAPQIGIHKNVAIVRIKTNTQEENIDLVNPKLIECSNGFIYNGEGCLSLPGVSVNTFRYREIFIKDDLHPAGFVATGLTAVVICHELDHLKQILITDIIQNKKVGRNDPCPCGKTLNGKAIKYKRCHGG